MIWDIYQFTLNNLKSMSTKIHKLCLDKSAINMFEPKKLPIDKFKIDIACNHQTNS